MRAPSAIPALFAMASLALSPQAALGAAALHGTVVDRETRQPIEERQ